MGTPYLAQNYETMLYDESRFVRPRHIGLRSKWADTQYISHKAVELYKKAQRRKMQYPSPVMPHFGHIPETMPPEVMLTPFNESQQNRSEHTTLKLADSRTPHATDTSRQLTKGTRKPDRPITSKKNSDMWKVPSWLAALYPTYSASIEGMGTITVQGLSYEPNDLWKTYLHLIGKHYRNTLVAYKIHDIKEHYQALMADEGKSAAVREEFYGRITADKALQKVMKKLGIRLEVLSR